MIATRKEFNNRVNEIESYFELIEKIEKEYNILSRADSIDSRFIISSDLFKVLKANGFMLLYNLIESTILNSINDVFDKLTQDNIKYGDVSLQIQKYWIKYCYKHDDKIKKETVINQFYKITEEVLSNAPISIKVVKIDGAGSLDTNKIRDIAAELGIILSLTQHHLYESHSKAFTTIKQHRNDLAHGKCTFSDIGKNITYLGNGAEDLGLFDFKIYTIQHLDGFITDVKSYLDEEKYLK